VAHFTTFVEAADFQVRDKDSLRGLSNHPVVNVTWHESLVFCRWLTEQWHQQGILPADWQVTLPSEAEWEKAARGGLEIPAPVLIRPLNRIDMWQPKAATQANPLPQRRYPWDDKIDTNRVNFDKTGIGNPSSMGCFPGGVSPYGCLDMSGNVWEWTRSNFKDYLYDPRDGRENLEAPDDVLRVLRGGAFGFDEGDVRCAIRGRRNPDDWGSSLGFRVVLSPFFS
jgi:formylglycine-generating enzyme required for sulfatase activity